MPNYLSHHASPEVVVPIGTAMRPSLPRDRYRPGTSQLDSNARRSVSALPIGRQECVDIDISPSARGREKRLVVGIGVFSVGTQATPKRDDAGNFLTVAAQHARFVRCPHLFGEAHEVRRVANLSGLGFGCHRDKNITASMARVSSRAVAATCMLRSGEPRVSSAGEGSMDLFKAMTEMRAMRRLKPDPVPDTLITEVIRYATHAPSGINAHNIRYIVVRDLDVKRQIASLYKTAWEQYRHAGQGNPPGQTVDMVERSNRAIEWQVEHLHEAPVLLFPALSGGRAALRHPAYGRAVNGQVWVAVQNLMLACRALGLGATITTLHLAFEEEVDRILGVPADSATFAMIPIGYPMGRFGPTRFVPPETAIAWDRW